VPVGELQHAVELRQRGGRRGRALQPRLREEDAGVLGRDRRLEGAEVVALRHARHRHEARARHAQREQQVRIARVVDQHRVARAHEAADRKVERMARPRA
jgi:hypothetical protein